jgi:hypothetical protein
MAGITVSDIMNANQLWSTSATSWADFLLGIQNNASYLDTNVSHPLSAAWQGTAAELATGQVNTAKGGLIDTASKLSTVQGLIENFNDNLSSWQQQLGPLVSQARSDGFDVGEDGTVSVPPLSRGAQIIADHDPSSAGLIATEQAQAAKLQDDIQAILKAANNYDDETAAVLRNQLPTEGVALQNPTKWDSKYSSLSQIALAYYGNANMWPLIYEANKNTIKNPNLISTSMKLVIPAAAGRPETTASLTPAEAALLAQASGSGNPDSPTVHITPEQEREFAIANGLSPSPAGSTTGTHPAGVTYEGNPDNDSYRSSQGGASFPPTTAAHATPGVTFEGNPNNDSYRSSQGGASLPSTTSGDPIAPNSQGLYLPPNASEAESNAS